MASSVVGQDTSFNSVWESVTCILQHTCQDLKHTCLLRMVPTIVTAHREILGFPMGGAY